jgi:hypothetical protein
MFSLLIYSVMGNIIRKIIDIRNISYAFSESFLMFDI